MCRKENSKQKSLTQDHTPTSPFIYLFLVSYSIQAFEGAEAIAHASISQSSTCNPSIRPNSRVLCVTSVRLFARAIAAICKS